MRLGTILVVVEGRRNRHRARLAGLEGPVLRDLARRVRNRDTDREVRRIAVVAVRPVNAVRIGVDRKGEGAVTVGAVQAVNGRRGHLDRTVDIAICGRRHGNRAGEAARIGRTADGQGQLARCGVVNGRDLTADSSGNSPALRHFDHHLGDGITDGRGIGGNLDLSRGVLLDAIGLLNRRADLRLAGHFAADFLAVDGRGDVVLVGALGIAGGAFLGLRRRGEEEERVVAHALARRRHLEGVVEGRHPRANGEDHVTVAVYQGGNAVRQPVEGADGEAFGNVHGDRVGFGTVIDVAEAGFDLHRAGFARTELVLGVGRIVVHRDGDGHRIGHRVDVHVDGGIGLVAVATGQGAGTVVVVLGGRGLDLDREIVVRVLRNLDRHGGEVHRLHARFEGQNQLPVLEGNNAAVNRVARLQRIAEAIDEDRAVRRAVQADHDLGDRLGTVGVLRLGSEEHRQGLRAGFAALARLVGDSAVTVLEEGQGQDIAFDRRLAALGEVVVVTESDRGRTGHTGNVYVEACLRGLRLAGHVTLGVNLGGGRLDLHREVAAVVDRQLHADHVGKVDIVTGSILTEGQDQAVADDAHVRGYEDAIGNFDLQGGPQRIAIRGDKHRAIVGTFQADLDLGDGLGTVLVDQLGTQRGQRDQQAFLAGIQTMVGRIGLAVLGKVVARGTGGQGRAVGDRLHLDLQHRLVGCHVIIGIELTVDVEFGRRHFQVQVEVVVAVLRQAHLEGGVGIPGQVDRLHAVGSIEGQRQHAVGDPDGAGGKAGGAVREGGHHLDGVAVDQHLVADHEVRRRGVVFTGQRHFEAALVETARRFFSGGGDGDLGQTLGAIGVGNRRNETGAEDRLLVGQIAAVAPAILLLDQRRLKDLVAAQRSSVILVVGHLGNDDLAAAARGIEVTRGDQQALGRSARHALIGMHVADDGDKTAAEDLPVVEGGEVVLEDDLIAPRDNQIVDQQGGIDRVIALVHHADAEHESPALLDRAGEGEIAGLLAPRQDQPAAEVDSGSRVVRFTDIGDREHHAVDGNEGKVLEAGARATALGIEEIEGHLDLVAGLQLQRGLDRRAVGGVFRAVAAIAVIRGHVQRATIEAEERLDVILAGAIAFSAFATVLNVDNFAVEQGAGVVGHGVDDRRGGAGDHRGLAAVGIGDRSGHGQRNVVAAVGRRQQGDAGGQVGRRQQRRGAADSRDFNATDEERRAIGNAGQREGNQHLVVVRGEANDHLHREGRVIAAVLGRLPILEAAVKAEAALATVDIRVEGQCDVAFGRIEDGDAVVQLDQAELQRRGGNHPLGGQQVEDAAKIVAVRRRTAARRGRTGGHVVQRDLTLSRQRQRLAQQHFGTDVDTGNLEGRRLTGLGYVHQIEEDNLAVGGAVAVIVESQDEVVALDQDLRLTRREVQDIGLAGSGLDFHCLTWSGPVNHGRLAGLAGGPAHIATKQGALGGLLVFTLDLIGAALQIVSHNPSPN